MEISQAISSLEKLINESHDDNKAAMHNLLTQIQNQSSEMADDINDQQLLYETTLEHSTEIENELSLKNDQVNLLMEKMRKYLSKQLYDMIIQDNITDNTDQNQRKKLSVFFSDIVGFTDLTDSVEPELLASLLNQYLNEMSTIANEYGGTIDKFIGDAIMIYFGNSDDDDDYTEAKKCVEMALAMQTKMRDIRSSWLKQGINHHLEIRIGINTGFCTIGNFGSSERMDFTIIGGQVNAAARLEHLSESGGIMISGSTYNLIEDIIDAEFRGQIKVKGIQRPIEVYQIIGRKDKNLAAKTMIKERKDGFDLKPILFRSESASSLERHEYASALRKALEILELSPNVSPKSLLDK